MSELLLSPFLAMSARSCSVKRGFKTQRALLGEERRFGQVSQERSGMSFTRESKREERESDGKCVHGFRGH